jgi:hypothetical protein
MTFARLLVIPAGLALAVLAFANAASENGWLPFGPGAFGRSGIDAHAMGELADRGFRAESVAAQAGGQAVAGRLTAEQAAALVADPEALERFLEERRRVHADVLTAEFPRMSSELLQLAKLAYAADPLNVAALRTIALGEIAHDDPERAREAMRLVARLSKRDDITNLWLAEDYGRLGNMEGMLASFDHALRTSRRARESAIGPIVNLVSSPESHAALGGLLRQRPDWEVAFWNEFARNPVALANAGQFFENSGLSITQLQESTLQRLYANLKRTGNFEALFQLADLDSGAASSATALAEGKFVEAGADSPLGWALRSRGEFAARVHSATGELQIDARAGSSGVAADRVIRGGRDYRMALTMVEPVPDSASVRLTATCVGEQGVERARILLEPGDESAETSVPAADCPFLTLALSFRAQPGRSNPLIRIASIVVK